MATELCGIDVSYAQNTVDWARVAADGVDFAILKASQGRLLARADSGPFADRTFISNVTGAAAAGLPVGAYHYLCADTVEAARAEAAFFIKTIRPYRADLRLWAAVDVEEDRYLPRDKRTLSKVVLAFAERVAEAGFTPMLYTNPNYLRYRLNADVLADIPLWLAYWGVTAEAAKKYRPTVWQTGLGRCGGVSGAVDRNIGYFSLTSLLPPRRVPRVGDRVRVTENTVYGTTRKFRLYYPQYDVMRVDGERAVIGIGGIATAAVHIDHIEVTEGENT